MLVSQRCNVYSVRSLCTFRGGDVRPSAPGQGRDPELGHSDLVDQLQFALIKAASMRSKVSY
jgi:hypothetical protein